MMGTQHHLPSSTNPEFGETEGNILRPAARRRPQPRIHDGSLGGFMPTPTRSAPGQPDVEAVRRLLGSEWGLRTCPKPASARLPMPERHALRTMGT